MTESTGTSPYMTCEEAAEYLRLPSAHAMRLAVHKFGIPHTRLGRQMRFTKLQLDEFMSVATDATNPEATNPSRSSRRSKGKAA